MKDINSNFERGVVNAMMPSMHLIPQWISRLFEDCPEDDEEDVWPIMLIKHEGRRVIWNLSAAMGVDSQGVPGQACRLMERYLSTQIRILRSMALDREECQRIMDQMTERLPLTMVSCIQLAAKMCSVDFQLSASFIRACLIFKGLRLSIADINESEYRVYSMLGFRVPLWTSVEAGEVLAVDAGLPHSMLRGVALIVNLAEYRRDVLENSVRWAANLSPKCDKGHDARTRASLRTLHLVAGCVAAAARYLRFKGPDPAPRLADRTRAPLCYIRCVSNCVLSTMIVDESFPAVISRKRPRE